jgi:hypothetical protein
MAVPICLQGMTMTAECTLTHGDLVINRVGYTPAGVAATEAHDAVYMNDAAYLDDVRGQDG